MNWYPFDLQTCSMVLSMKGKGEDFASLYPDQLRYLGKDEVNQYVVYSYKMQHLPEDSSKVEIVIKLGRNLLTIILTTFVPTVLLNIISYSTIFFKPFFFEATVTVNLTAMLVLTTLFINVQKWHQIGKTISISLIWFRLATACLLRLTSRWLMFTLFSLWWFLLLKFFSKPTWKPWDCEWITLTN